VTATAGVGYTAHFQGIYSIGTSPYGLTVLVDGQGCTGGCNRTGPAWASANHILSAPSPQTIAGTVYVFSSWSDGGAQTHQISGSSPTLSFVANFTQPANCTAGGCSCDTLLNGGVNGNPNDFGALATWVSNTYRLNGNEVYMSSNASLLWSFRTLRHTTIGTTP
jgi:hypothetical protein